MILVMMNIGMIQVDLNLEITRNNILEDLDI
jgi:hypothetical protein